MPTEPQPYRVEPAPGAKRNIPPECRKKKNKNESAMDVEGCCRGCCIYKYFNGVNDFYDAIVRCMKPVLFPLRFALTQALARADASCVQRVYAGGLGSAGGEKAWQNHRTNMPHHYQAFPV